MDYQKSEVLKAWFGLSLKQREQKLTFRNEELISTINCLNAGLLITDAVREGSYKLLENIDTFWEPELFMKLNPKLLKGNFLINLIQSINCTFLNGHTHLKRSEKQLVSFFKGSVKQWSQFELVVTKLLQQRFLEVYIEKLNKMALKASEELLQEKKQDKKLRKPKKKRIFQVQEQIREEVEVLNNKEDEGQDTQFIGVIDGKSLIGFKPHYTWENLVIDWDASTQADTDIQRELPDSLLFQEGILGYRSFCFRRFYANKAVVWDDEMTEIRNSGYRYPNYPLECVYPVVKYFYS